MIRDHATRAFNEKPFDLIITGHMHILDDWTFERNGRQVRSVNLGSWFGDTQVFNLTDEGTAWVPVD
jgi:UDP-2,3-diacylglucosamine hydrolase